MQSAATVSQGLREMAGLLLFLAAPRFKRQAYERAADTIKVVDGDLTTLVEQGRLRELPGIGQALARQIEELWNTGSSIYLDQLRADTPPGTAELIRVPGLTPRRILALTAGLGIGSVRELREACLAGRLRNLRGFGAKTEQKLLAACELWLAPDSAEPPSILLSDGWDWAETLGHGLTEPSSLAGDFRRAQEVAPRVDLVVQGERKGVLERVAGLEQVLRVDHHSNVAYLGQGVTIHLHVTSAERWGNTLVDATGSAAHVTALKQRAADLNVDWQRDFATEAKLYEALGLHFVPPELREGSEILEAAQERGFQDLLTLPDVRGMVHCHTTYSDGKNSVLEMARAAEELGMQYLTITDHSPSAHYASGVALDRLQAQWDEIAEAQTQTSVRILRGTESDILRDGALDYPDDILEQFDVVIASIHARHKLDRSEMTARLVRALSLPYFKIWGHGLGRILNHRPPIDCDVPAVLDALAAGGGAIELNADPYRLDLPPAWIPAARERNIPFVVSVDAHSTKGFGVLRYGVAMARRGGLTPRDVLNTLPAAEFAQRVRPTRAH